MWTYIAKWNEKSGSLCWVQFWKHRNLSHTKIIKMNWTFHSNERIPKILVYSYLHHENRNEGKSWFMPRQLKNNLISFSIPVIIFKQVDFSQRLERKRLQSYQEVWQNSSSASQSIERIGKSRVMPATSTNTPTCTICRLVCKLEVGLKSHIRHKYQNWGKLLVHHISNLMEESIIYI